LDKRLRERGFVVLCWLDAGWVRFFSKDPIEHPDQLKRSKLFVWSGDTAAFDVYKSAGFHPVALETNDILPMLKTGMISAIPSPPYIALTTQTFTAAPYMLDIDWAPLVGALVVTERAWNKLTPAAQTAMARAAFDAGAQMKAENRAESEASVEAMKKRGLRVLHPTPQVQAEWLAMAEPSYPDLRGKVVPAEFFDEVRRLLAEYRSAQSVAAAAPRPQ
jgi:TRAP-type C4-dicarboxylate transport system substrate-binding protein